MARVRCRWCGKDHKNYKTRVHWCSKCGKHIQQHPVGSWSGEFMLCPGAERTTKGLARNTRQNICRRQREVAQPG